MKNLRKMLLATILAALFIFDFGLTASAGEISEAQPGVEVIGDCRLTFSLTDQTGGAFSDDVMITLLNTETSLEYTYKMTSADYLLGITVAGNVKQGNYSIALSYENKGTFTIQNADGTDISSFAADSTEHVFDWVVSGSDTAGVSDTGETGEIKENPEQSGAVEGNNNTPGTGIKEADDLWEAFLNAVAPIESNSEYSVILEVTQKTAPIYSTYFENATGRDKEDYINMTPFEQFLWYATYIMPYNAINASDYDTYCGSVAKWLTYSVHTPYNTLSTHGTSEMADAYRALMEWDYYYFIENGTIMNFMTGNTSLEHSAVEVVPTAEPAGEPTEPQESENYPEESQVREESPEDDGEKGIWDGVIQGIKDNAFSIAILIVLLGAVTAVVIYRKHKAINDDMK